MSGSSNFPAYMRRFGAFAGLGLYFRTKLKRGARRISVPGMSHPLYMRTGTSDRSAFNEVIVKRWYDHPFPGVPQLIIDAGANVGYASVRFAELYPNADIVAIEPDRGNFAMLQQNVAPYPRVRGHARRGWSSRIPRRSPGRSGFARRAKASRASRQSGLRS
jgi:hypothetical protein